jgi:hypothetical protein
MCDQFDKNPETEQPRNADAWKLRFDLLRAARIHDHLTRLAHRLHVWIALHALLAIASVLTLAWYYSRGHCCP